MVENHPKKTNFYALVYKELSIDAFAGNRYYKIILNTDWSEACENIAPRG
jgi:hypothetical protein